MRLDKFLCEMNIGTRSQVKALLKQGLVSVNGQTAVKPDLQINTTVDQVTYRGEVLFYEEFVYYMLNKPAGVVSATEDNHDRTVIDLLREELVTNLVNDIFPVGRLDKDTEGLLLLTNDGDLAHRLLSPRKHVEKTYYVQIEKELSPEDLQALEAGVDIGEDQYTLPARVSVLSEREIRLTITEGKFHQVKRMLRAVDNQVLYLKRLSMGTLVLDETLEKGQFRRLHAAELQKLKEGIGRC